MRKGIRKISSVLLALHCAAVFTSCDFTGGFTESGNSRGSEEISSTVITVPASDDSSSDSSSDDSSSDSSSDGSSDSSDGGETVEQEELSIHFLELGNNTSGACTLIDIGDTEVLIDAGSTTGSAATIVPYIKEYCEDGVLEYVIATHYDSDHISAFVGSNGNGVFDSFICETIIDSALTTKTSKIYKSYVELRDKEVAKEGAVHYTSLQCWNNEGGAQRSYDLGEGVTLDILYQKYYETKTSTENNYSVCLLLSRGENHYLFTGDLEKSGEESLLANNTLPKCTLYKAGHHGSNTASSPALLEKIQPDIVVISCCCGDKYQFPHQETLDTISKYTDKVYIPAFTYNGKQTLLNGNIVVSELFGKVSVQCSNNDTLFKDTDWFKENRTLPDAWKS